MKYVLRFAAALALAVAVLGIALLPLETPIFTRVLAARYSQSAQAGLSTTQTLALAEQVRAFVVAGRGSLPPVVNGHEGFDASQVSHLGDVRTVLRRARLATLGMLIAAAVLLTVVRRLQGARAAGAAMKASAVLTVVLPLAGATAAIVDFDAFFSAFHAVFFSAGTWTFPSDSLLIRLFPEPFWLVAGASWAVSIVVFAGVLGVAGRALARR